MEKENGRRSGVGGWGCGTQFGDKLVELGAVAIAEVEDFDAEQPAGANATDDALGPEAEVIDLEAEVELVAGEPDIVNPMAMTFDERLNNIQNRRSHPVPDARACVGRAYPGAYAAQTPTIGP